MEEVMPKIWETHKGRAYTLRSGIFDGTQDRRGYSTRSERFEGIHKGIHSKMKV